MPNGNPSFPTPFEKGNGNQTVTYEECIAYYEKLDSVFDEAKLFTFGTTAAGKPIHLLVLSASSDFDATSVHLKNRPVLLINNGIHPGEPDGIDASMLLVRDLLIHKELRPLIEKATVCIVPVFNVSGMLNRGNFSRVNQNGPESYGFRGTSQNYDLNRDFAKCDTRETQAMVEIFQTWKPHLFVDTHVSNGADYPYTMTLIPSQKDKLHPVLSGYQEQTLLPRLYRQMKDAGFEMTPYVNPLEETPDSGIVGFLETARYSTGYAALFNCIGMMPETHMLKPYRQRVHATYALLLEVLKITGRDAESIVGNKKRVDRETAEQDTFPLEWSLNESKYDLLLFKGYEAKYKASTLNDSLRLWYDPQHPYEKEIRFYNDYQVTAQAVKPYAYLIPQAWEEIIDRLRKNGIVLHSLLADTLLEVEVYHIDSYNTSSRAFEGHYPHSAVKLSTSICRLPYHRGDFVIIPDQAANRYIVEMLEPQGMDSYFTWNFFDPILMRKEYYSAYVFEDLAAELLEKDPVLKQEFLEKKIADPEFAKDPSAQLEYLYRKSPWNEPSFNRYPVTRLLSRVSLPLE